MSIQEHLNKIRNAVYGREVRESIAKGIETAYDDASENGNANMEVKMARGTNPNLNTRLNKMDETDRQTTAQLAQTNEDLNALESSKASKLEVESKLATKVTRAENESISWGMLSQYTKDQVTGDLPPAIVGVDSVNTSNVVNKAITANKRTSIGDWGILATTSPVNFDFTNKRIDFSRSGTVEVIYQGKSHVINEVDYVDMAPVENPSANRVILYYDLNSKLLDVTINTGPKDIGEDFILLATFRIPTETVFMFGNYTINGQVANLGGKSERFTETNDVFYRYRQPEIVGNKIVFPKDLTLYAYKKELGQAHVLGISDDVEFDWKHNSVIIWNLEDNKLENIPFPLKSEKLSITLARNIDGNFVSGALKNQYETDMLKKRVDVNENNTQSPSPKPLKITDINKGGLPNGSVVVGDEFWAFGASNDEHTDFGICSRWTIEDDYSMTFVSTFKHNWGHCNSLDYREETDTLILGNGSGDYDLEGKIFIIEKASELKLLNENDEVSLEDYAKTIDVGMSFGSKVNVIWGDDNFMKFDIAHVITNDNKNISKILLGRGTNELEKGQFIAGVLSDEFNGTYKVLSEYSTVNETDVVQGAFFGDDGYIYVGLGHDGSWFARQSLNENGTISGNHFRSFFYNDDGSKVTGLSGYTLSIAQYKDKLILRTWKDGDYAVVIDRP